MTAAHATHALQRYQIPVENALHTILAQVTSPRHIALKEELTGFFGQLEYHMGWVDKNFQPTTASPGKLIRPSLVLLAFEAVGAEGHAIEERDAFSTHIHSVLPVAAAVQFIHEFTLIHDDIEDMDAYRRNRETIWKIWGIPQAINTGDAMFTLGRCAIWEALHTGLSPEKVIQCAQLLDQTCLSIAEGQFLDIRFEDRDTISLDTYFSMIERKTGIFLQACARLGALSGTRNEDAIEAMDAFGATLGRAFQIRDDILGTWAAQSVSGKVAAGDIIRRKKSLPVIHALHAASPVDTEQLHTIYKVPRSLEETEVATVLDIFERTETRAACMHYLEEQTDIITERLQTIQQVLPAIHPEVLHDLQALAAFVGELPT